MRRESNCTPRLSHALPLLPAAQQVLPPRSITPPVTEAPKPQAPVHPPAAAAPVAPAQPPAAKPAPVAAAAPAPAAPVSNANLSYADRLKLKNAGVAPPSPTKAAAPAAAAAAFEAEPAADVAMTDAPAAAASRPEPHSRAPHPRAHDARDDSIGIFVRRLPLRYDNKEELFEVFSRFGTIVNGIDGEAHSAAHAHLLYLCFAPREDSRDNGCIMCRRGGLCSVRLVCTLWPSFSSGFSLRVHFACVAPPACLADLALRLQKSPALYYPLSPLPAAPRPQASTLPAR